MGPSPLVVPVDNKHRGSWLKTLNSARSWQMTSRNSAEDHPLTYAVEFKQDARTQLSTHNQTKSAKQCPVQLCYTCRRMKYAEACLGTSATGNRLLTRWQEWCLLLLPQISAHSVSDILCTFWYQMTDLLGEKLSQTKALCRTAAGLPIRGSKCMCNYDTVTDSNAPSIEAPSRKLVLSHSLLPSMSKRSDARRTTVKKVAHPCRKIGQRRVSRPRSSRHKVSNRTNKDKNDLAEADSCRNGCCCCCCCCLNSSSLLSPFDLNSFVDHSYLSSFHPSSVCVVCSAGATGANDNHSCARAPAPRMKLHNDHCASMHASCLGLLEHVEKFLSPTLKPAMDPRSFVFTGTMRRRNPKRHMHKNLQRHHANRLLPSIVFNHRANLLGRHRHLQNARFGSKIKEESSKQTIFRKTNFHGRSQHIVDQPTHGRSCKGKNKVAKTTHAG